MYLAAPYTVDSPQSSYRYLPRSLQSCDGQEAYEDALYVGVWEVRGGCSGTGSAVAGIVAGPEDGSFTIVVLVQMVTDADLDALDHILQSFVVTF
jgi:serine protease Do